MLGDPTQQALQDKYQATMARAAAERRVAELEAAMSEIQRRTGLLIHQNTGRWNMSVEHDKRTADVLIGNQEIAAKALGK